MILTGIRKPFKITINEATTGGHWITITDEDGISTHIFLSGGGNVTKGPSNLIGANIAHLPEGPHRTEHHKEGVTPKDHNKHPQYTEHPDKVRVFGKHGPGHGYLVDNPLPNIPKEEHKARLEKALALAREQHAHEKVKSGTAEAHDIQASKKFNALRSLHATGDITAEQLESGHARINKEYREARLNRAKKLAEDAEKKKQLTAQSQDNDSTTKTSNTNPSNTPNVKKASHAEMPDPWYSTPKQMHAMAKTPEGLQHLKNALQNPPTPLTKYQEDRIKYIISKYQHSIVPHQIPEQSTTVTANSASNSYKVFNALKNTLPQDLNAMEHASKSISDDLLAEGISNEDAINISNELNLYKISASNDVQSMVKSLLVKWSETSGDTDTVALLLQHAADEELGVGCWKTAKPAHCKSEEVWQEVLNIAKNSENTYSILKKVVRSQYNNTQKWFKENNITHVTVFRGMGVHSPEYTDYINNNSSEDVDVYHSQEGEIPLNPISSFSFNSEEALGFLGKENKHKQEKRVVLMGNIPVQHVMSTFATGYGGLPEKELTVLGYKFPWTIVHATDSHDAKKYFDNNNLSYGAMDSVYSNR